jgi:hypothetical protein
MKSYPLAALAALFVLIPCAGALTTPTVTFIPDKISINSSFIMIADAHPVTGEYVSVGRWIVFGVENGWGLLPRKIGEKRASYFSNSDPNSDSPSPFIMPSYGVPYELEVNMTSNLGQTVSSNVDVVVGSIPLSTRIDVVGNTLYMRVWPGGDVQSIQYKTYYAGNLELVPQKSGYMSYFIQGYVYNTSITLPEGSYYIAFSASTSTDDFGGGVSPVAIGPGTVIPNQTEVKVDKINYMTTIKAGQTFLLNSFSIINTGNVNLTGLSITVPPDIISLCKCDLTIVPEKSTLQPNESTHMVVTLKNLQQKTELSFNAPLYSGSRILDQVSVSLLINTVNTTDYTTCTGRQDMEACISSGRPGVCCSELCKQFGECCRDIDCEAGKECSGYKCESAITAECLGKTDMDPCTGGVCCSESCKVGGECCSSFDCTGVDETCKSNICTSGTQDECSGKADDTKCTGGVCCSGSCTSKECCTDDGCQTGKCCSGSCVATAECCFDSDCGEQTCNAEYKCAAETPTGGLDIVTIAMVGGGVAIAALVGLFAFKKFKKKGKGEEEIEEGGEAEEDEFSDEDFY